MEVSIEHADGLERRIRVRVPAHSIEDAIDTRLRDLSRNLRLKGFRPGKVPDGVVRQRYGTEVRREVLQEFLQRTCREAIKQRGLEAVGPARIEQESGAHDADLVFLATFEIYPEFAVQGMEGLVAERPVVAITEADVDELIERLRRQRRAWTPVLRPAQEGDRITIDFQGSLHGEALVNARGEGVQLVLGEADVQRDFAARLTGASAHDRLLIELSYPEGFPDDALVGRTVQYETLVREVEEATLPEVTPGFCQSLGVPSGTISDLREAAGKDMIREAEAQVRDEVRLQLLSTLSDATSVELPRLLCEQELSRLRSEAMRRAGHGHIADVAPAEHFRHIAERNVRMGLIIRHLFKEQRMRILREEVTAKIAALCPPGEDVEKRQNWVFEHPEMVDRVEHVVMDDKVVDWLLQRATIVDRPMTFVEFMDMRRKKWGHLTDVMLRLLQ